MASQDPKKEGPKYAALAEYLKEKVPGVADIKLRVAKNYAEAAKLFEAGEADGMVAGSFVAAVFIGKEVAKPVARPLGVNGVSTYKALVVAKEGTKPFAGLEDFRGKRVAYSGLASSGEIFARSLLPAGEKPESVYTPVLAPSHQAAFNAVSSGAADYAVGKNTIWNPADYPGLAVVGGDDAENPDNTIIMPNAVYAKHGADIVKVLTGLEGDSSPAAEAVRKAFKAKGFLATTAGDFDHTNGLVKKAHVDPKSFDFVF
jgi:ABC-type nitrate/sulfonate/bicarbonate transport system substrate-binding protein